MTYPAGPPPDYLSLAIERLMGRLLERAVDAEAGNAQILRRLDMIMADQTQFAAQLTALDSLVQGFSDLFSDVHGAAGDNQTAVDVARAEGEQAGFDEATANLAQGLSNAQAVLDALRAQFAAVTGAAPADPPADPPVDSAPVDAPPAEPPVDAPAENTPIFDSVLGRPGA